jgi:hypothetical protein
MSQYRFPGYSTEVEASMFVSVVLLESGLITQHTSSDIRRKCRVVFVLYNLLQMRPVASRSSDLTIRIAPIWFLKRKLACIWLGFM